jgi:hypothetical protein
VDVAKPMYLRDIIIPTQKLLHKLVIFSVGNVVKLKVQINVVTQMHKNVVVDSFMDHQAAAKLTKGQM